MSHFTVLVVGNDIEKQLQPYHEYECTGINDEYVVDVDKTEEARKTYSESTETVLRKKEDGSIHDFFDEQGHWRKEFSQPDPEAPELDKNRRIEFVPEGYEKTMVPTSNFKRFKDWAMDWYGLKLLRKGHGKTSDHEGGYVEVADDGAVLKVVDRTNPNAKWDWWTVGGRWSEYYPSKNGGYISQGMKSQFDFEEMRKRAAIKATTEYDLAKSIADELNWESWNSVIGRLEIEVARKYYNEQEPLKMLQGSEKFKWWFEFDDLLLPREQYIEKARLEAIGTFAVVKDGQWLERGKMGWWAVVHDEKDRTEWFAGFNKMIDELPDNTMLTIVDCHI